MSLTGNAPKTIQASTRFCAVYGHPIKHSASPAMHNPAMAKLGLDWRYLAFDVAPEQLPEAIKGAAAMKFVGLNLTVPHKVLALKLVDLLDASASKWGAVNTIRFEAQDGDGAWKAMHEVAEPRAVRTHGFNTDADAIIRAVREDLGLNLKGTSVLLLGAGGAGRVAALRLAEEGIEELWLVNRTMSKVEGIASEIRARYPAVRARIGYPPGSVDLVLNATSLGLQPDDPLPLDVGKFPMGRARAAYDMVYRPAETPFLRLAAKCKVRRANGLGMLLYQGAAALEIWSGKPAPVAVMRQALRRNVYG